MVCLVACSSSIVTPSTRDKGDAGPPPGPSGARPRPSGPRSDGERLSGRKVEETGAECKADADCEGTRAICITQVDLSRLATLAAGVGGVGPAAGQNIPPVLFPGGYCSALCTSNDDCNPGAGCGVRELLDLTNQLLGSGAAGGLDLPLEAIPAQCLDRCSRATDCRDGYVCDSLIGAATSLAGEAGAGVAPDGLGLLLALFPRYCLPKATGIGVTTPEPVFDAGPRWDASMAPADAGRRFDAGADADVADANTEDASVRDAAIDDASTTPAQRGDGAPVAFITTSVGAQKGE